MNFNTGFKLEDEYQEHQPIIELAKGLFNVRNFMMDDENPNPKPVKTKIKTEV